MRTIIRPAAVICALLATFSVLMGPASAAPQGRAADWLSRQLTDGLVVGTFDGKQYNDYGLTADTGLALAATGGHQAEVRAIRKALARHVNSWTTGVDFGLSDVYAGSVAKAVVLAQTAGANPRSFGGVDLIARLNRRVSTDKGIVGRIQDKTAGEDFANTIGQAFAAAGLARADARKAGKAVRFLLAQQCRQGYFRLEFSPAKAKNQTCDGARKARRAPDTDVTALSVLMLRSVRPQTRAVRAAVADALGWLVRRQHANGSFGGGPATEASNTNSTGLASWALARGGKCRAADNASDWVAGLQKPNGAIAYDRAGFRAGITAESRDQWRRATSQAAPALQLPGC